MKSFSEAGGSNFVNEVIENEKKDHELLMRTQSEEPRSPYMKTSCLPWPEPNRCNQDQSRQRQARVYKEIFIDFQPADMGKRSRQSFTQSDGEFLSDFSVDADSMEQVVDRVDGVKVRKNWVSPGSNKINRYDSGLITLWRFEEKNERYWIFLENFLSDKNLIDSSPRFLCRAIAQFMKKNKHRDPVLQNHRTRSMKNSTKTLSTMRCSLNNIRQNR